jgi:hypothetical protein
VLDPVINESSVNPSPRTQNAQGETTMTTEQNLGSAAPTRFTKRPGCEA